MQFLKRNNGRSAFTLIELLVVIAVIAILSVVVILTLNPAELLRQSRDANRLSDLDTLNHAIGFYDTDQGGSSSFSLGTSSLAYISIPDPTATTTNGTDCSGIGLGGGLFHCAASSTYKSAGGKGWIPINFSKISYGAPLSSLPIDPVNQTSSDLLYGYVTDGSTFKVSALPESQKYTALQAQSPNLFYSGSNLSLNAAPNPVQANYITQQDLGNSYWTKLAVTVTASDTLMETTANSAHDVINQSLIARTAGIQTYEVWVEATPVNGRGWLEIQIFDSAFAKQIISFFDVVDRVPGFSTGTGGWSVVSTSVVPIPGTSRVRLVVIFTTDASSNGLWLLLPIQPDQSTNSYVGDTTKGMKLDNIWLYNVNAGAGGM